MTRRPYRSVQSVPNILCPSGVFIFPTTCKNGPDLNLNVSSAAGYSLGIGESGEVSINSKNFSLRQSNETTADKPIIGEVMFQL